MFFETLFEFALSLSDDSRNWLWWDTFLESTGSFALHGGLLLEIFIDWRVINTVLEGFAKLRCLLIKVDSFDSA